MSLLNLKYYPLSSKQGKKIKKEGGNKEYKESESQKMHVIKREKIPAPKLPSTVIPIRAKYKIKGVPKNQKAAATMRIPGRGTAMA